VADYTSVKQTPRQLLGYASVCAPRVSFQASPSRRSRRRILAAAAAAPHLRNDVGTAVGTDALHRRAAKVGPRLLHDDDLRLARRVRVWRMDEV
jgi:hypothetical protein